MQREEPQQKQHVVQLAQVGQEQLQQLDARGGGRDQQQQPRSRNSRAPGGGGGQAGADKSRVVSWLRTSDAGDDAGDGGGVAGRRQQQQQQQERRGGGAAASPTPPPPPPPRQQHSLVPRAAALLWAVGLRRQHQQQRHQQQQQRQQQRRGGASAASSSAAMTALDDDNGAPTTAGAAGLPTPVLPRSPHWTTERGALVSHPLSAAALRESGGAVDVDVIVVDDRQQSKQQKQHQPQQQRHHHHHHHHDHKEQPQALSSSLQQARQQQQQRRGSYLAAALKAGDDAAALVASLPRTLRTLDWALRAALSYKRLLLTSSWDPLLDPEGSARRLASHHDFWARELTEVCRANGGVYVKAGQFAAAFGALPMEYRHHLALLQDKARPRPFRDVDRVLRLELGEGAERVFSEFSAEATAAASLAQVHKARLADGSLVAVKVQYPGLRGAANADLTTLSLLSAAAGALFPEFRLAWLYDELRRKLEEELDFMVEVRNSQRLMECLRPGTVTTISGSGGGGGGGGGGGRRARHLHHHEQQQQQQQAGPPPLGQQRLGGAPAAAASPRRGSDAGSSVDAGSVVSGDSSASSSSSSSSSSRGSMSNGGGALPVVVPRAHVDLCTPKVLTWEWIDGVKVNDAAALRAARISPKAVGRAVDEAFAEMTFVHGYVHSDPHPGNVLVRPKGRRSLLSWLLRGSWQPFEVVLLDHGSYLSISDALRQRYAQLWCSLFAGDAPGAAAVAIELGGQRAGQILPVVLTQRGRNKEEQREMQRAAGVASFGDMTQLLASAPRDVVELLRIAAVVRNVTAALGCSLADRLRINGAWALRGLPSSSDDDDDHNDRGGGGGGGGAPRLSPGARLSIHAKLAALRCYIAAASLLERSLLATLHVFGQDVALL